MGKETIEVRLLLYTALRDELKKDLEQRKFENGDLYDRIVEALNAKDIEKPRRILKRSLEEG